MLKRLSCGQRCQISIQGALETGTGLAQRTKGIFVSTLMLSGSSENQQRRIRGNKELGIAE
jgi:hypothetical protein